MKNLFSLALISFLLIGSANAFGNKKNETETTQLSPEEATQNLLTKNDLNKDGKLAKNELNVSFRMKRFKTADTNADNYLDETELLNWFQKTSQAKAGQ